MTTHSSTWPSALSRPRLAAVAPASLSTRSASALPMSGGVNAAENCWARPDNASSRSRSRRSDSRACTATLRPHTSWAISSPTTTITAMNTWVSASRVGAGSPESRSNPYPCRVNRLAMNAMTTPASEAPIMLSRNAAHASTGRISSDGGQSVPKAMSRHQSGRRQHRGGLPRATAAGVGTAWTTAESAPPLPGHRFRRRPPSAPHQPARCRRWCALSPYRRSARPPGGDQAGTDEERRQIAAAAQIRGTPAPGKHQRGADQRFHHIGGHVSGRGDQARRRSRGQPAVRRARSPAPRRATARGGSAAWPRRSPRPTGRRPARSWRRRTPRTAPRRRCRRGRRRRTIQWPGRATPEPLPTIRRIGSAKTAAR